MKLCLVLVADDKETLGGPVEGWDRDHSNLLPCWTIRLIDLGLSVTCESVPYGSQVIFQYYYVDWQHTTM